MRLKEICLIVIATAMLCIFAQPALATSAMSVEPAYMDVWQGDEFTVDITVDPDGSSVYAASYTLHFDNTILNATSQTQGAFLTQDGQGSTEWWNEINNTTGKVAYSESRTGTDFGVTDSGVLATITFQVISDEGVSGLNISDYNGELLYSTTSSIPTDVYNGRVGVAQPPTPFLISGCISYEDGSDCNGPTVNITNLNTNKEWVAETDASSNYYQIMLSSCADVAAGDVLQFDAASQDASQSSITDHTVTNDCVDAGGFEYNIALESPALDTVVSIGSAEADVGDSVNVSINITDAAAIGSMDIRVAYNASILDATNVMNGSMIASLPAPLVEYHLGYVDINISFVTYPETINGAGELFIITFDVVGGDTGDNSPLDLEADAYTTDLSPVVLEAENGVVTVTGGAPDPAPSLVTYTISNTVISPDGDGIADDTEIDVEFSEPVDAAIRITDATGVVKTLYTGSDVADPDPQTWDGTDDDGNVVIDGTYRVNIEMDDGVNPAVYDTTGSIRVGTSAEVEVYIDCGSIYPYPDPGCSVTLPITLRGIMDYGAGTINLYYDASIVAVGNVNGSEDSSVESWNVVTPGWLIISALNTAGVSGDVVFANVTFNSVGNIGECSYLNLTVDSLGDIYYEELPYFTTNCSIGIEDPYAPIVSSPSADPATILNDNGRARVPGTNVSVLSVIVTDENGVAGVTVNVSPIWGPGNDSIPMTNVMGTDEWTVEVNAPYNAGVNQVHNLEVTATDQFGNSNSAKTIELTILRRGDVVRDNKVDMFDYLYIARYTVGLESAPDELVAGTVSADSHNGVNMLDALYIARHTVDLESAP